MRCKKFAMSCYHVLYYFIFYPPPAVSPCLKSHLLSQNEQQGHCPSSSCGGSISICSNPLHLAIGVGRLSSFFEARMGAPKLIIISCCFILPTAGECHGQSSGGLR